MANLKNKTLYRLTYRVDGKVCFAEMHAKGDRLRSLFVPSKEAHRFEGWKDIPERMPAEDLVIDGGFAPLSYELIYLLDGVEYKRVTLAYGEKITAPKIPSKNGYEFSGWENLPETMPAENVTVSGKYIRDSYSLTYLIDDTYRFVVHLPYGAKIEPLQLPVKDQHVFSGWIDLPETMPADDIVVAGKFEMRTFRLTRIVDGEVFMAEDLPIGAKVDKKVKPVKPGYYFSGWRKLPDTMPDHDITAITSMYPVRYRVDYEIDGEIWRTTYVPYTTEFVAETPEEREGMVFLGWSDAPAVMPMQDIVVHGAYAEAPAVSPEPVAEPEILPTYTLRCFADGELIAELSYCEGDTVCLPEVAEKNGYRFSGFEGAPETMPASDLELSGSYLPLSFKLTYLADGKTVSCEEIPFGTAITAPEAPEKIGSRFVGWGELPETMPAEDLTLEASYETNLYRVAFVVDGVTLSEETLPFGAEITVPVPESKIGASFLGFGEVPETVPASDLTLEGSYQALEYRLSFVVDGEEISSSMLPFGAEISVPEVAERPGFLFKSFNAPETMPAEDLTLVGSFVAELYPLRAEIDGELFYETELTAGEGYVLPEPDARLGYSFAWTARTGLMPIGPLTVSGSYTARSYTLTFKLDGEVLSSGECRFGDAIVLPVAPVKEGYTFLGFGDVPETMPASDLVIEGSYEAIPDPLYTLSFTVDGETVYRNAVTAGTVISAPTVADRLGFGFAWESFPETMPAEDLTVVGAYTQNLYTLRFAVDGETVLESAVAMDAPLVAPDAEARVGFDFAWAELPETMPASDLVIEGSYTQHIYKLSFTVDGEAVSECEAAYGDAISLPEMPTREGYSFAWTDAPETMPALDLSIEGAYKANGYKLTFVALGNTVLETTVSYGDAVSAPEAPAAEGMEFLGWDALPETMPASDVVCTASYETKLYSVEFRVGDEVVVSSELPFGAELIVPEMPVREGFDFAWDALPASVAAADLVICGSYAAKSYKLLCLCDGETISESEIAFGEQLSLPTPDARLGYSFAWVDAPETMPASDLTLEGVYTPELYTLTLSVDGEILSETEIPFGEAIPEPVLPSKIGYTFSGFGTLPETMPAESLTYNGTFTCNSYRFTVVVGGETLVDTVLLYGAEISLPEVPERIGYIFSGFGETPETMPANDLTVAADYTPSTYRLTFVLDGETVSSTEVSFGSRILTPILDLPEGRIFDGWKDLPETMPAEDLTLTAETVTETYHVTYLLNGESILEADVIVGEALPTPEIADDPGYSFTGFEIPVAMESENLVLKAERTPRCFNLTVKLDDEILVSESVPYGSEITLPEVPAREGFSFSGFGEVPATMPAEDLVISGAFYTDLYHVAFLIDGTTVSESDLIAGAEIMLPSVPEREGYTFSGFGEVPATMPAENLVFTASYSVDTFRLSFVLDGKLLSEELLAFGAEIKAPTVELDEESVFGGWKELPETMPAHDLEITGSVTAKTYTLRYQIGDELIAEQQVAAGITVDPIALPASDGAELRWSNLPTEMPHYDVTVSAVSVEAETYQLRFLVDGESYAEYDVCCGAAITLPEPPVRAGMEFVAWQGLPETMPGHALELSALFRIATYKATFKLDSAFYAENLYCEGTVVPEPYVPAKPGYTFSGWRNYVGVMPDYDFTAVGSYVPNQHTVQYLVNGEELLCETRGYGESIVAPEAPVFPDGEFLYWDALPETMPDSDLVIEAVYNFPSYHLSYRLDGAVYYETDMVVGRILPKLNPPEKYGMVFGGWKNFPRVMPGYDLTVYGNYLPAYRTVTYLSCGETLAVRRYRVGDPVVSIDGRNPAIGEFEGWFDLPSIMPDEDVVATARYKARTYCITYLLDDKPVATQNVAVGEPIQAPIPPVKADYVFREWENLPKIMPASDLIIRGVYESTVHTIIYRVDGEEYRRAVYPIGSKIKAIAGPEKLHDRFVSWTNFTDVMPAYDFAVDAVYEPNIRFYKFIVNGETLLSGSMRAGDPLLAPTPDELPDLDFVGYDGYDGIMPPTDVVYVGRYEPKLYQLCYVLDGEIWRTVELHSGDAVPEAEEPRLPLGYSFSGWSAIPEVMPNHDVDVLGTSEAIPYKLTVIAENRTVSEREIPYGSVLSSYKAPRRHGYTFRGWEGLPEFMPAADITVSGRYEPSEPVYTFCSLPAASYASSRDLRVVSDPDEKRRSVMKKGRFSNVIYVSGDRIQMVSRGKSYELDISAFVCDGEIVDRNGLLEAVCQMSSTANLVTTGVPYHLVIDHVRSIDTLVELASTDENEIKTVLRDRMVSDAEDMTVPAFSYNVLSVNEKEGTIQVAASVVDEEYFRIVKETLLRAGLSVTSPVTPQMGMIEYMQSRTIQEKCNSLVVSFTGGYLLLGFYLDGKLLATVKNAVPFDLPTADLAVELETMLGRLADHLEVEDIDAKIHHIFYSGFRVDAIKKLMKQMRKTAKRINRSPRRALAADFTVRKPGAYEIAYPFVKRRKKVYHITDRKA